MNYGDNHLANSLVDDYPLRKRRRLPYRYYYSRPFYG